MADDEPVDEAQGMQDSVGLLLLSRREQGRTLSDPEDLPPLLTLAEVYGVHRALSATASTLGHHVGWKCGACAPESQAALGLEHPFRAPLFQGRIFTDDRTTVDLAKVNLQMLEAEFAFIMRSDLPPRESGPYTAAEVWDAVALVVPAIEVCGTRWAGEALAEATPLHRIADGGINESCALGDAVEAAGIRRDLDQVGVRLLVNGEEASAGSGANVLEHPVNALTWLANELLEASISTQSSQYGGGALVGLMQGDLVMSGAATLVPAVQLKEGDVVTAEFDGMGSVEVAIVDSGAEAVADAGGAASPAVAMDPAEWRQLCAEAREAGATVPMIYPWSAVREASVRELLAEAAADPHKELRAELDGLKLSELKKRARGAGVDDDALDEADDEDDVRAAVVALLLAAMGAPKL